MLSFIYRLLTRARKQDEVTEDMIGTFEEARVDARSRGQWNYFVFGVREVVGLLGSPGQLIPMTRLPVIAGGALAGLALGVGAFYLMPASYTSEAVIGLSPPTIPASLLQVDAIDLDSRVSALNAAMHSRAVLTTISYELGLYPNARVWKPVLDVIEDMSKAIRLENAGNSTIRLTFTYRDYPRGADDALKAVKTTQQLVTRLFDTNIVNESWQATQTVEFFTNRVTLAAESWEKLNKEMRGMTAEDPRFDRLTLDRELARNEYESLRHKLSDAEVIRDLNNNKMGRLLTLQDSPSEPQGPDTSLMEMASFGLANGLLIGFIVWVWLTVRSAPSVLLTPEATSN